uniref:C2H2-type domain-containing protein n=1 Tax=viral metagenome TaxID=1070528 RepID=A0A6C0JUY1_9ZZZZ
MNQVRSDKVKCNCGAMVRSTNMTNHRRRMFHMLWLHQSLSHSK